MSSVLQAQSTGTVLMVRPAHFAFNPETAPSNAFQVAAGADASLALQEFDGLVRLLGRSGLQVIVAEDSPVPVKPDAIFPNNWVSFHRDGTVVLYPMLAPNRRLERRDDLIEQVVRDGGFRVTRAVDLSYREKEGKFLEGTGSLVLDRTHSVAYASLSARTDLDVLGEFAQLLDYDLMTFDAVGAKAQPVYHTNVLMAVGTRFAVLCSDAIVTPAHRAAVLERLRATDHEVIEISQDQMLAFAGNMLELHGSAGTVIALSQGAWRSLEAAQRRRLESFGNVIAAEIPVIERLGGGGVRCMLAEIHLPNRIAAAMS
jgi:hypothetical protein